MKGVKLVIDEVKYFSIMFESGKLALLEPLTVKVTHDCEDRQYIACTEDIALHGVGKTEKDAVKDLQVAIEEHYFDLKKEEDALGHALKKEWGILRKVCVEK